MKRFWNWWRALRTIQERIDKLEAATYHGNQVHCLIVPWDMSTKEAWTHHCNGGIPNKNRECRKVYVLTDRQNNLLRVLLS